MTDKETMIRSVLFLVIGILLLLSLVICVYIVSDESKYIKVEADVTSVKKDTDGTGKNEVTVSFEVDGTDYHPSITYKDDVNVDDKISIYYKEDNPTMTKTYKTSKMIFVCPAIGLILCLLGLFELFRKDNGDGEEEFKTSVINVVDNTQQLKIVTENVPAKEYQKTSEEKMEAEIKTIKKDVSEEKPKPVAPAPAPASKPSMTAASSVIKEQTVAKEMPKTVVTQSNTSTSSEKRAVPIEQAKSVPLVSKPAEKAEPKKDMPKQVAPVKEEKPVVSSNTPTSSSSVVENAILKKVQNSADSKKVSLDESEIKDVIRDVLKEVLQEVKAEKQQPKKVVQKRVLPNYYYISGTSLIYVEPGKETQEVELKTIKKVVRTVNSEGNVVKLVVSNEEIKCILTNMKNIDLEQVANLLHNKMRTIDENFKEEIEHKEY